jgi:shikimate dehydrogenase
LGHKVPVMQPATPPWNHEQNLDHWDLLVNTTPVGMWPKTDASPWPESVRIPSHWTVFDLVYNPVETRLLHQAQEGGARAIDGLEMLVRQGALSFKMWTGIRPSLQTMRTAAQDALENNGRSRPIGE